MIRMITAAAVMSAAFPALAAAQTADRQIHVSYHDLDLRKAADLRQLDRRLKAAIETACSDGDGVAWQRQLATKRCRTAKQHDVAAPRSLAVAKAANAGVEVASTR